MPARDPLSAVTLSGALRPDRRPALASLPGGSHGTVPAAHPGVAGEPCEFGDASQLTLQTSARTYTCLLRVSSGSYAAHLSLSPSALVGHAGRQSVPGWAASIRYGFLAAQDNSILLPGPLLLPSHSAVGGRPGVPTARLAGAACRRSSS